MIYNSQFIWLHLPKCAGTKIEDIFRRHFSNTVDLHQDIADINIDPLIMWHDSVQHRMTRDPDFTTKEKRIIVSIRRLKPWLVSRYNYEVERSPNLPHQPEDLLEGKFLESSGELNHADSLIDYYIPPQLIRSGKIDFLRVEHFESDFLNIFGRYFDLSSIPRDELGKKENSTSNHIPANIINELQLSQSVYSKCPRWREIEEIAYP